MSLSQSIAAAVFVQVTVITLIALVAMHWARQKAALRHAIGVVALVLILISPAFSAWLPRGFWLPGGRETTGVSVVQPTPQMAAPAARDMTRGEADDEGAIRAEVPPPVGIPEASSKPPITWPDERPARAVAMASAGYSDWIDRAFMLAACVWAGGILVIAVRFFSVRRQIRSLARSVAGRYCGPAADEARCLLGLESLPLVGISEMAPMPLVLGWARPVIVLPRWLVEAGPAPRLRDVLVHELAHVVRRDPWIHAAQRVAACLFWPHPGVHWLNRAIARGARRCATTMCCKRRVRLIMHRRCWTWPSIAMVPAWRCRRWACSRVAGAWKRGSPGF